MSESNSLNIKSKYIYLLCIFLWYLNKSLVFFWNAFIFITLLKLIKVLLYFILTFDLRCSTLGQKKIARYLTWIENLRDITNSSDSVNTFAHTEMSNLLLILTIDFALLSPKYEVSHKLNIIGDTEVRTK